MYLDFVEPEKFHITTRFLGELRPDALQTAIKHFSIVGHGTQFEISLSGDVQAFNNDRQVIYAGIKDEGLIEQNINQYYVVRSFVPHITVARTSNGRINPKMYQLPDLSFVVDRVQLIQTVTQETETVYQVLAERILK